MPYIALQPSAYSNSEASSPGSNRPGPGLSASPVMLGFTVDLS